MRWRKRCCEFRISIRILAAPSRGIHDTIYVAKYLDQWSTNDTEPSDGYLVHIREALQDTAGLDHSWNPVSLVPVPVQATADLPDTNNDRFEGGLSGSIGEDGLGDPF